MPRRILRLVCLLAPLAVPAGSHAQSLVVTDVETMGDFVIDATVTCPRADAVYVSGSYEGCPTGRAPADGECGLSWVCPAAETPPEAVATADHIWAHVNAFPLVLDLGQPSDRVFVFNAADHGPFPEESVEWTVWGRDSPDVTAFPDGWSPGRLCAIFRQGWVESGDCPGEDSDDFTGLYVFDRPYRFVAVYSNLSITIFTDRAHTLWAAEGDDHPDPGWQSADAELDAVSRPTAPPPTVAIGPDRTICTSQPLTLAAGVTGGTVYRYNWDTDGDGLTDATADAVTVSYSQPGRYTVAVSVVGECGCDRDEATVTVRECPLAVTFGSVAARRLAARPAVEVVWTTLSENETLGFLVERADARGGPFRPLARVPARGAGASYRVEDALGASGGRPWYRVVEMTSSGRGDATPPFPLALVDAPAGARRRR